MNEQLLQLIEQKDFNELSADEQHFVREHMSEDAYSRMRQDLLEELDQSKLEMAALTPDRDLLAELHKEVKARQGIWAGLIRMKISLPAAAAVLLFMLSAQAIWWWQSQSAAQDVRYITHTDTLRLTRDVHHFDTVYIEKELQANNPQKKENTKAGITQKKVEQKSRTSTPKRSDRDYYLAKQYVSKAMEKALQSAPKRKSAPSEPCNICEIEGLIISDQLYNPIGSLQE